MLTESALNDTLLSTDSPLRKLFIFQNTIAQWRMVYWLMFVVSTIFTLLYNFMAEAERQQWDIDAELQED